MKSWLRVPSAFYWAFAMSSAATSTHAVALESNESSSSFNFIHAFRGEANGSSAVVETLRAAAQQLALVDTKQQLLLITTPSISTASNSSVSTSMNTTGTDVGGLEQRFSFAGENRVGFEPNKWQVELDKSCNGSVWTRLRSLNATQLGVCVVIAAEASVDAQLLVELTTDLGNFCTSTDTVILGFTTPLSDDLAQYLEAKTTINGQYVTRSMNESVALAEQASNAQLDIAATTNRLFVSLPTATPVCLETAGAMTVEVDKLTVERVDLCVGEGCSTCRQSPASTDSHGSPVKRGLVVLLSCGTFLIGCAVVFYVFFRKQFFMPSDSTKPEKDLTTNLAYVLRM